MARKKNISFDSWKSTLQWIATVMSIMIILFLAIEHKSLMTLNAVDIEIAPIPGHKNIITDGILVGKIEAYLGFSLEVVNIQDLNLVELEHLILSDDRVKSAEVYIDAAEEIHVEVQQRIPVLRVISDAGDNYYLDEDGNRINRIKGIAARVPVVSGQVSAYDELFMTEEYEGTLTDAYQLSLQLREDKFLSALIEQIYIDELDEMILIPKLGDEEIAIGTIDDSKFKLQIIKDFYQIGLPREGWNKFKNLQFKYKGKNGEGILFAEK